MQERQGVRGTRAPPTPDPAQSGLVRVPGILCRQSSCARPASPSAQMHPKAAEGEGEHEAQAMGPDAALDPIKTAAFIFPDTQPPRSALSFDPHFTDEVDRSGVTGGICLLPEPLVTCPFVWPCCSQRGRELRSHAISFSDFFTGPGLSHGAKKGSGPADIMPFSTTITRLSPGPQWKGTPRKWASAELAFLPTHF